MNGEGSLCARATLVSHCLLIETGAHGLVLVDTAIGVDDVRDTRRFGPRAELATHDDVTIFSSHDPVEYERLRGAQLRPPST